MSDTWELISGYEVTDYTDTMVFEVDPDTKKLEKISGQTLVEGEKNSQFIRFLMPRFWDGIDISEKTIRIIFDLNNSTYFGGSEAVGAERTDDKIRFGWVVPAEACAVKGTLLFVIIVQDSGYVLKTQITDTPVLKSLSESGDIPEPTKEIWYENFKVRVETAVSDTENALSEAQIVLEQARRYVGAPLVARTAADMDDTDRVYVYTGSETGYTSGHWYYWDGTAWTDGGVYNSVAVDTDTTLSISGKAADAKETGDQITELKSGLSDFNIELDERTLYQSENLYNPALQTENTISPHYYANGVPSSQTSLDATYNCTALIPISPNTEYTIGVIPSYTLSGTDYKVPWANATQGVFAYDADGNYIQNLGVTGTFTTPSNARYIRFNYIKHTGYSLATLNNACMLVKGNALPSAYSGYTSYTVKDAILQVEEKADVAKGVADSVAGNVDAVADKVELLLGDNEIVRSSNLYDSALQTSGTISPHYYVNGVPYSSTQYDGTWNCTALFPIESDTEYTIGLVPSITFESKNIVLPWHNASQGIFFYDADGGYIKQSKNGTFVTPSNAAFARFNFYVYHNAVTLQGLNAQCMLVKGSTLPETYQEYGDKLTSELQEKINGLDSLGIEFKFSGSDLLLAYGYTEEYDAVVVFNEGRANGLFDFAKLGLKKKDKSLSEIETSDLITVWNSNTDMHAPFQFNAVNNADGYKADSTSPGFVGGNHTLDQLGSDFKTASSKYVRFYADGSPVTQGSGKCLNFVMRWANDVQAYNTVKEGGGGRACLTEYHDMIFDGVRFTESIKLIPLEDIDMRLWYGLQFTSWGNAYNKVRFVDAENRGEFAHGDSGIKSGNIVTSGIEAYGDAHKIEVTVDTSVDLGKRVLLPSNVTDGAFMSGSKGYFSIIKRSAQYIMQANTAWYLKGSYRFYPTVIEE